MTKTDRTIVRRVTFLIVIAALIFTGLGVRRTLADRAFRQGTESAKNSEQELYGRLIAGSKESTNPQTLMRVGATALTSGYPQGAYNLFIKATTVRFAPPDAYVGAARAQTAQGNSTGALETIKAGLAYNPIWQPLLTACIAIAQEAGDQGEYQICYDRLELLRQVPTWQ